MADAVYANHDAPLDLCGALQEALRVAAERADHRNREEHMDRSENAEQVEVAQPDEQILSRQDDKESEQETAVVGAPRVRERDELAQRDERNHAAQRDEQQTQPL